MRLYTEQETKNLLLNRIKSGDWWLLMPAPDCAYLVIEIEEKFYSGEAGADFTAIMGATKAGVTSVYLAHKRRMNAQALFELVGDRSQLPITVGQLEKHDIIFLAGWQEAQILTQQLACLIA